MKGGGSKWAAVRKEASSCYINYCKFVYTGSRSLDAGMFADLSELDNNSAWRVRLCTAKQIIKILITHGQDRTQF